MDTCTRCNRNDEEVYRMLRCPSCFKHVCQDCAKRHYGRYFCSEVCAQTFFHSDDNG